MTDERLSNVLAALPASPARDELVTRLLAAGHARIDRIVSTGQASPPGFWYEQEEGEWVVVLQGRARLSIHDEAAPRVLGPGDFVDLPPHTRHRIDWTDPTVATVWLAVFYR
jgi:cupin 2 domain-containing protein